jgi:hypothetical protein
MFPFSFISSGGVANTERTEAFLTATGITDATIISALNAMDTSLISAGLLPSGTGAGKIIALYPFVGGTASTHKFNFVDPADTDAAFRLVFNGGFTHSSSGCQPNGTNGWANTFLTPSIDFSGAYYESSYHDNLSSVYNGAQTNGFATQAFTFIDTQDHRLFFSTSGGAFNVGSGTNGFHQMQRNLTTDVIQLGTARNTRGASLVLTVPNVLAIGGIRGDFATSDFNNIIYKYRAYGSTFLTNGELDKFNNLVVSFQTTLGRQV